MAQKVNPRCIMAVVGPTASGKSALAVSLARRFNGEVISADSRQVYRGLDIGTGKITKREMHGVSHHLLDVANPRRTFTVVQYQRLARRATNGIWRRGKLPVLCGGTGFYIDALINGPIFPNVKPNAPLRRRLEQKTNTELFCMLQRRDSPRARTIDRNNRRRLIRALEITTALGAVPKVQAQPLGARTLILGLNTSTYKLRQLIKRRLTRRLRRGLVGEVQALHRGGLSWRRLESFGLEYRAVARYLQGELSREELQQAILRESWQYARRQLTWFKKMPGVTWVRNSQIAMLRADQFIKNEPVP